MADEYIKRKTVLDAFCMDNCERKYEGCCNNCRAVQLLESIPAAIVGGIDFADEPCADACPLTGCVNDLFDEDGNPV